MSGHTKGPWTAELHDDHTATIRASGGTLVAELYGYDDDDGETVLPIEANAALFAAAPDLYAACEALLDVVGEINAERRSFEALDDARAALAKARGER